ncbi:hypothetical protein PybrP1_002731 [[Pythium] brassicae (nom. inval.)]|nr:hypothetical protein PybrP1_002731 [[Pythium] brassicae (nom. inval.)]
MDCDSHFMLIPRRRAIGVKDNVVIAVSRDARLPAGEADIVDKELVGGMEVLHLAGYEVGSDDEI